ncbi:MAG: hypothetical protein R3F43_17495 [bacterium]
MRPERAPARDHRRRGGGLPRRRGPAPAGLLDHADIGHGARPAAQQAAVAARGPVAAGRGLHPWSSWSASTRCCWGQPMDRGNFRKKIRPQVEAGVLVPTGQQRKPPAGRPAALYRFDEAAWRRREAEGAAFEV